MKPYPDVLILGVSTLLFTIGIPAIGERELSSRVYAQTMEETITKDVRFYPLKINNLILSEIFNPHSALN
jgi:hypothetical protein